MVLYGETLSIQYIHWCKGASDPSTAASNTHNTSAAMADCLWSFQGKEQSTDRQPQATQAALKMGSAVDVVATTEFRSLMRFPAADATALAAAEALAAAKSTPVGSVGPRTVKVGTRGMLLQHPFFNSSRSLHHDLQSSQSQAILLDAPTHELPGSDTILSRGLCHCFAGRSSASA